MKKLTMIMLTAMMVFLATAVVVTAQEVDVRGTVTNVGVNQYTWDNSKFAGFYYDIDKNLGNETITFMPDPATMTATGATLSDQQINGNRGVVYNTQAQLKNFKYKAWGQYNVIGFLAERYFAAYDPTVTADVTNAGAKVAYLYDASKNRNLMTNEQISKVLMDDNKEMTITSANPLKLSEGYQLAIKSVDVKGNKAYIELSKNGQVVDSKVVQPSIDNAKMSDQTYYYKTALGSTSDIIQIAVHFKNAFAGSDTNIATVDGEFQVSDTVTPLKSEQAYDKMSIRTVDATKMAVMMDNKDNQITLSKNKDVALMQNIYIKTADQDGTAEAPLRYYIYKKITDAGTYQLRGTVANVMQNQVSWDNSSFSGFYYDIDKNLGAETLTFRPDPATMTATGATLSDQADANNNRGVVYETQAQLKKFKYKAWGQYNVIGFLANKYFAAYDPTVTAEVANVNESVAYLYDASKNRNLMTNEQISKVLMDDNKEMTITSANPLALQEGYQLAIKSVDVKGNKAYLELSKNGQVVDSKVVQPSIDNAKMSDQTYYYKTALGSTSDIIQIAVHFKNAFAGSDTNIATVDGEFQVSDTTTPLKSSQTYDKMSIRTVDATGMAVIMDNKDNQITLSKNKDVVLMQNVYIKTADQDGTDAAPLRYYIYKKITAAGAYQLRGTVANVMQNQVSWDNSSFSGFYYDIDKNLGAEMITFRPTLATPTGATLTDQEVNGAPRGVVYETQAQLKKFKYKPWGQYDVIGFLANKYFAAYDPTATTDVTNVNESVAYLYDASKNRNLMTNEQISQVLMDDNKEMTITSASPLALQNGYQLAIKSIDVDGNKAYLELSKNGQVVDSKVVQPSISNARMKDQTYYYKASLGDTTDIIQIAVHFKNAFRGADTNIATVDGEFQISDTATPLKTSQTYDKMSIRNVDATGMKVTMDNKDNQITLSKNKDVVLMQDIHIKTADQDGTDAAPLRYYIYKAATIAAANATAPAAAAAPAAAPAANVTKNVTAPATPAPEAVSKPANATAPAAEKPANATAPAAKTPGFEGIFAITGLMAVAYLVLGRKQ